VQGEFGGLGAHGNAAPAADNTGLAADGWCWAAAA